MSPEEKYVQNEILLTTRSKDANPKFQESMVKKILLPRHGQFELL